MDSQCVRQTVCKVLNKFQHGKYLVAYVLKGGKAQDIHGLAAEHLKHAVDLIAMSLANLMDFILHTGHIPLMLLEGLLTHVPKKDKDHTLPTNYRGITVLSILGKVLEKVLKKRTKLLLTRNQSCLQRGFTKK